MIGRGWRERGTGNGCLMGTVSVWEDEEVLEMNGDGGCTAM